MCIRDRLKAGSGDSGPASWAFCVFHRSPSDDMSFLGSIGGTLLDAAKTFPLPVHDSFHAEAVAFA
eukprot:9890191-Karenia_brevis.AAC.1